MGDLDDLTRLPDDFDGQVRLFPLPSLVLFPHAMQPLHIFEPRYCEMLADALQSDSLIAMATLSDVGAESKGASSKGMLTPHGIPAIDRTVCIGRIVSHVEREDERHNILLVGIKRANVTAEIDAGRSFRIAKIDVMDDLYPPTGVATRGQLRADLLAAFGKVIPATESVQQGLSELLAGSMGLGPITDIISHTVPLPVPAKLQLLAEPNVDQRASRLIDLLASGAVKLEQNEASEKAASETATEDNAGSQRLPFPPPFSMN